MARLGVLSKSAVETKRVDIDFTPALVEGDLLSSVSVLIPENTPDTPLEAVGALSDDKTEARIVVSGGELGELYNVLVRVTMDSAQLREECFGVEIVEACG